ncbi:hypothetical protein P5V15_014140 [Pogonomyrmex californicus]
MFGSLINGEGDPIRWLGELCRPLNCKKKELCLLEDTFTAVCVSKKELHKSGCQECPVVKPTFLCGSDNRTYSSPCRLEYHNCIHHTSVHITCKGFCPCKVADLRTYSKKTQMQRKKMLMGKMGRNHDITLTPRDFNYDNHHYQYLKYTKHGKVSHICFLCYISVINDRENVT